MRGELRLIFGPMFSGKTTEGMRQIRRIAVKSRTLNIKFQKDTRYSADKMSTHDKTMMEAVSCESLVGVDIDPQYTAIFIDEGQFFLGIKDFALRTIDRGITVIIAALDGNFMKKPFLPELFELIPHATEVKKLSAVCKFCSKDASFTMRLTNDMEEFLIGSHDIYAAACGDCHKIPGMLTSASQ